MFPVGEIHHLPQPSRSFPLAIPAAMIGAPTSPAINIAARRHVTVAEAARKLAMTDCAARTIIDRLRALYDHAGLPDPDNHRFVKGVPILGARRIHAGSLWDRGRFLAWLDNGDGGRAASAPLGHPGPSAQAATRRRLAGNAAALIGRERKRA
jgi:hypothetical protein